MLPQSPQRRLDDIKLLLSQAPQKIFGQWILAATKQSQNLGTFPPIKLDHIRPFFSTKGDCMVRTRDQYKWIVRGDLDTWTVITSIDVDHRLWPKFSETEQNYFPTDRPFLAVFTFQYLVLRFISI